MIDYLIRNAWIIDGTGAPATYGDVGVAGSTIAAVGKGLAEHASREIDATGLTLAPGFWDPHTLTSSTQPFSISTSVDSLRGFVATVRHW